MNSRAPDVDSDAVARLRSCNLVLHLLLVTDDPHVAIAREETRLVAADDEEDPEDAEEEEVAEEDEEFEQEIPKLDIGTFALKVARLAELPEKVLDLKDAIINRAIHYLQTNYDDNIAKEFENALMDNFQLAVPEEEVEKLVASDLPPPAAVGAGPLGGAGG